MSKVFLKDLSIKHICKNQCFIQNDQVIAEERVAFYLNGTKLLSVMTIPYEQDAHLLGFLIAEGVISDLNEVEDLRISDDGLSVFLDADIDEDALNQLFVEKTLTSGCCVGVSGNLDTHSSSILRKRYIDSSYIISLDFIEQQMREFQRPTPLFEASGCVHKAMLILPEISLVSEDIGRHNAIDKVMGKAYLQKLDTANSVLFVSGRLSLEMVVKAVMHRVPIIISKAAATFQGIQAAEELGITLIGFARGERYNIYTHSERIQM
ncbi:sulfurtransferase FdhD [Helicobacter monodelphidis]|uniref:formate dehydrogenase accessory sulfurtransferase FdhD n=1 Tax=Helicobacter sp. 15-1451 TaxID=2004995 RepID=UPI000DCCF3B2|nr:formate dehydrogenase accessory sulfurtransferase FdhD [Helicobacter sp. 15-1451]RAX57874.1 sulfurtransferase FdhD [Helicobacter sp. 15-1451]